MGLNEDDIKNCQFDTLTDLLDVEQRKHLSIFYYNFVD